MMTTTQLLMASLALFGVSEQQRLPWFSQVASPRYSPRPQQQPPLWTQSVAFPQQTPYQNQPYQNQPNQQFGPPPPQSWPNQQSWPPQSSQSAPWPPQSSQSAPWPPKSSQQSRPQPTRPAGPTLAPLPPRPTPQSQPKQQPRPAASTWGEMIENTLGNLRGAQKPIPIRQCPKDIRCQGRENVCVPHPSNESRYLCVKVDDECGTLRNPKCPSGQECLADPRDTASCRDGWCTGSISTGGGICATPPK